MLHPVLTGVRVLDLSRMLAGPYGTLLLADLGADVIKIEDPEGGDPTRLIGPPFAGGESAYFLGINRNKRSLALDLTKPEGRAAFHDLVRKSDVVFDNFRPGILEKLGADDATLRPLNPRIITCSVTAFGEEGPYRDVPAFDLVLQAMGGGMSVTGEPGRPPVRMGFPIGDLAGGMFGAYAVAAALYRREKTGTGEHLDLALLDCQVALLTYLAQYHLLDGRVPGPQGSAHESVVPYQAFQTADGWIVVGIFVEKFWASFCGAMDLPELACDPRYDTNLKRAAARTELLPILERRFLERPSDALIRRLWEAGVPSGPINSVDRAVRDPQVTHRGMVVTTEHPKAGRVDSVGSPVRFPEAGSSPSRPAPLLGEQTEAILREVCGYETGRIAELRRSGVCA
ncbi:MAG: CoA transferase [Planctomycetes bacterium]|nr:CoA transferase [Planctomycetota bacterium]